MTTTEDLTTDDRAWRLLFALLCTYALSVLQLRLRTRSYQASRGNDNPFALHIAHIILGHALLCYVYEHQVWWFVGGEVLAYALLQFANTLAYHWQSTFNWVAYG